MAPSVTRMAGTAFKSTESPNLTLSNVTVVLVFADDFGVGLTDPLRGEPYGEGYGLCLGFAFPPTKLSGTDSMEPSSVEW